jgi:hypothetical protein
MLSLQLDKPGPLILKWPTKDLEIIQLGRAYVTHEATLLEEQLKDLPLTLLQPVLETAELALQTAGSGETARATAAETIRQVYLTARPALENAFTQLKARYFANLAHLEAYGLDTVAGKNGVSVRKPRNQTEWLAFLEGYVKQETSLAPADRLPIPPLADLQTLLTTYQTALATRTSGRNTREINVQSRSTAVQRLLDLLQVACAVLVVTRFNGLVTNDLQKWGFTVQAKTAPIETAPPA